MPDEDHDAIDSNIAEQEPDLEPDHEPEAEAPAPKPPKPRRVVLPGPTNGGLNLQFVQAPADKPKPETKKKPSPFEQAQRDSADSFERQAASLGEGITWTLEKTAPKVYRGRKVPCGIFPEEFTGPAKASVLGEIGGGGTYYVSFEDPTTGKTKRLGPITIAGEPKFDIGIEEEQAEDMPYFVPQDFRAGSQVPGGDPDKNKQEWIKVYDPRMGWVVRRADDVEREARAQQQAPMFDAMKASFEQQLAAQAQVQQAQAAAQAKAMEDMKQMFQQMILVQQQPKEDPMAKWMEIERMRADNEKAAKAEEMKFLREKMEKDAEVLQARLNHEKEMAETRLEAEKARAETERRTLEAKLEAERDRIAADKEAAEARLAETNRIAGEKIDKSQELILSMMKEKSNPMENIGGMLGLFREFNELTGPAETTAEGEQPKTKLDRFFSLMEKAAEKAIPALEPMLRNVAERYVDAVQTAQVAQGNPAPKRVAAKPKPEAPEAEEEEEASAPAPAVPAGAESAQQEKIVKEMAGIIEEMLNAIDTQRPVDVTWKTMQSKYPLAAFSMSAYNNVDELIAELKEVANDKKWAPLRRVILDVVNKASGPRRKWAEALIAEVHK